MITKDLIHEAQNKWGEGIVKIGSLKNNQSECIDFTTSFLNDMYNSAIQSGNQRSADTYLEGIQSLMETLPRAARGGLMSLRR